MATWKCNSCGNTLDNVSPPETCPVCKQKCEFINVTCYIPDCGGAGSANIDPNIARDKGKK